MARRVLCPDTTGRVMTGVPKWAAAERAKAEILPKMVDRIWKTGGELVSDNT
jgi:hypothetical protein